MPIGTHESLFASIHTTFYNLILTFFTQLNTTETDVGVKLNDNKFTDDSDSEDQDYQDFLSRTLPDAEDTDDEDYVYEMNGEDTSDTDSQSSVATEDLSDDEHQKPADVSIFCFSNQSFFLYFNE